MKLIAIFLFAALATTAAAGVQPAHAINEVCLGPSGGVPYTPGWWQSKHGRAAVGEHDLFILRSLNLVDAGGNTFDPLTYDEFRDWLKAGDANNMAYSLSVHLATGVLNVINGAVSSSLFIYAPGTISGGVSGIATFSAVLHEAGDALAADQVTLGGDPNRAYQEALKNAIDAANNDQNFIQQVCLN